MKKKKLLFICTQNQWRSPTAERLFDGHELYDARSAGTARNAQKVVSTKDIEWADIVFVMEKKHKEVLQLRFENQLHNKKLHCLDIPNDLMYMDRDLVELLCTTLLQYNIIV